MTAPMLIFLSFVYLLAATTLARPQPHLPPHHAGSVSQDSIPQLTQREEPGVHTSMRAWKRTDSIGVAEQASVFVCEHVSWGGKCETKTYNLGTDECAVLDGTASSAGPDPGFACVFYKNAVCRDFSNGADSVTLRYPGSENLIATEKGNFNDQILAFQCYKEG